MVTWFWSKPSSSLINHHFATKAVRTYTAPPIRFLTFFQWLHTLIAHRALNKCQTSLDSVHSCTFRVYLFDIAIWDTRFVDGCISNSNISRSIQERRLFRSARLELRQQFESGVWSSKYGIYMFIKCVLANSYCCNYCCYTWNKLDTLSNMIMF